MTHRPRRAGFAGLLTGLLLVCVAEAAPQAPPAPEPRFAALEVGDPAPPLTIARWLRGPEVARFEPGQVYVLDFWAVWCPSCIALLPHLSDLQDRLSGRGVYFAAITLPDAEANSPAAIDAFISRKAGIFRTAVAIDTPAAPETCASQPLCGVTALAYLKAAALDGIPSSVVVDRSGHVAWIGDPAALDPVVEAIASGTWDLAQARRRYLAWRLAEPRLFEFRSLLKDGHQTQAYQLGRELVRGPFAEVPGILRSIAVSILDLDPAAPRDLDLALEAARDSVTSSGRREWGSWSVLSRARFQRGELSDAIDAQQHAVDLAEGVLHDRLQRTLDEYRVAAAKSAAPPAQ